MVWTTCIRGAIGLALSLGLVCGGAAPSGAEWYAAGYGGTSAGGKLRDVTMPDYGFALAKARAEYSFQPANGDQLIQNFKTSDITLSNSPIFGAKVGYFFENPSFTWLGIEADAFTLKSDIKPATLSTDQDITYSPGPNTTGCTNLITPPCPRTIVQKGQFALTASSLRVSAMTLNLIARYPGSVLQPYVGVGAGAFYFKSTGQFDGKQFSPGFNALAGLKIKASDEWGLFAEGRYNLASVNGLDPTFGLSGMYSMFHLVAGVSFHF
jgi:opacity protein-like surface antigen